VRKAIVLNNRSLTNRKEDILRSFVAEYLKALDMTLPKVPFVDSSTELHHDTYSRIRTETSLPSDIVQEARKDVWKIRTDMERSGFNGSFGFKSCSIRLNKRWFKYIKSERGNPCFKITYSPKKSIAIPIRTDKQFQRFNSFLNDGWMFDNVSLFPNGKIAVILEKEFDRIEPSKRHILGIDVGSTTLAAITIYDSERGRVIEQVYLGRDVAKRQRRFTERRAKLKSLADKGSSRAKRSLKRLRRKQSNFVKTRSGQIAKEIRELAIKYNADIAIERLKNLKRNAVKGKLNKKARKKVSRIPYAKLKEFLESNCEMFGIALHVVDAYHTSKWCPHCGAINSGHHNKNYALYRCKECGLEMNSDRKASLAVAVKSALERNKTHELTILSSIQISKARVPVNGLLRSNDVGVEVAVRHTHQPMESHLTC
jgi:IS605 OrfB family transposase